MGEVLPVVSTDAIIPGVSPHVYGPRDFERIAALVYEEAGIVLNAKKQMLAYSRLAPLVRQSGLQTFNDYLDWITQHEPDRAKAIASLTTNHTYFNREPHHFEHFAQHVRPGLITRSRAGKPVRIWSAGCSSGEEIYTLLMVLLGEERMEGKRIAKGPILALASDLAEHAVNAGAAAVYPADAISKVPEKLRENWCEPVPGDGGTSLSIGPEVRQMVRFRQLNLLRSWPFKTSFDVIFCRNVMIYFDDATKEQLLLKFARQLAPGGYLYIGHSERISGPATQMLESDGSTIYRRRNA